MMDSLTQSALVAVSLTMSEAPAAAQNAAISQTYRLLLTHVVDFSKSSVTLN
jgi:hypothetical protein